jgi:hypothetical protein
MIARIRIDRLAAAERDELREIVAEARGKKHPTARFQSDAGDTAAWYLLVLIAATLGVFAHAVVHGGPAAIVEWWSVAIEHPALVAGPDAVVTIGVQLAFVAAGWAAYRLASLRYGHGWALTSFGFVRVRGRRLQVVRFADITRVERLRYGSARQRRFSVVRITARDGGVLSSYAGALFEGLRARLPETATVDG